MPMLGDRSVGTVTSALFQRRHYRAAKNMLSTYQYPADALRRYLFGAGDYPATIPIKTPLGLITPTVYSHHDILTINEIFCREDYRCPGDSKTIVDFGSNIGLSALYFLTRNKAAFAYLFEPLPQNAERLQKNLRDFAGRYEFSPVAVALTDGEVEFGYEESGRYGGIGLAREKSIRVPCRGANQILKEIVDCHEEIDVLKIDIESLEKEILLNIPGDLLKRIKNIFMEIEPMFDTNPLIATHRLQRYGDVAQFRIRPSAAPCGKTIEVHTLE